LLVETSSAYIQENNIHNNLLANIALGGKSSENTFIINNRIHNSSSEGIFLYDAS
jgi:hypothetical protein